MNFDEYMGIYFGNIGSGYAVNMHLHLFYINSVYFSVELTLLSF